MKNNLILRSFLHKKTLCIIIALTTIPGALCAVKKTSQNIATENKKEHATKNKDSIINNHVVNVLLHQSNAVEQKTWFVETEKGVHAVNPQNPHQKELFNGERIKVELTKNNLFINDKKLSWSSVNILPLTGSLKFDQKKYQKNFYIPNNHWYLTSENGFTIYAHDAPEYRITIKDPNLAITFNNNSFSLNEHTLVTNKFIIEPRDSLVSFAGRKYYGTMTFHKIKNDILLINNVHLEDYTSAVVYSEAGYSSWPLEAAKTHAIVSRTYALALARQAEKSKKPYHLNNSTTNQVYHGAHKAATIHQAVKETQGTVICHNNQPIVATFSSCCGGIVPADLKWANFDSQPYLARTYACTHCKDAPVYNWKVTTPLDDLDKLIKTKWHKKPDLKNLHTIAVNSRDKDKAGLVYQVELKDSNNKSFIMPSKSLMYLMQNMRSRHFSLSHDKAAKSVTLEGRGFGHHLGMCQWGMRSMVDKGYSFKDIIPYYYPGTTLVPMHSLNPPTR